MQAAREVFFSKGLVGSTIDEIAEKAELNKGTLYLYFDSKEKLYLTLLDEGLDMLLERFQEVASERSAWGCLVDEDGEVYYQFRTRRQVK